MAFIKLYFLGAFKTCIKHFGRLDIVINNAGVFDNSIERQWSATVNINYVSSVVI